MNPPSTTVLIVAPVDPLSPRIGGIQTYVNGFAKFAPADLGVELVGVTSAAGSSLPVGRWSSVPIGDTSMRILPVMSVGDRQARHRVPLTLRFVGAALRRRAAISTEGRVLQFHRPATLLPFLRSHSPKVQVIHHDLAQISSANGENRWSSVPAAFDWIEELTAQRVDGVVAVNESTADAFRQRHPASASSIYFIPNWFDDTIFSAMSGSGRALARQALRNEIRGETGSPVVLFAGRLEPTKNPLLALAAFQLLLERQPHAHLVVAGTGTLRDALLQEAAERRIAARVHLLGRRAPQDLAALMNGADALLVSSSSETGPTIMLEALACGLPLVGVPVGRIPRVISSGQSGWVASESSAPKLADGLAWAVGAGEQVRMKSVAAAAPYAARTVLEPLYSLHQELGARRRR
jgi:glycosyltransferase involved in cell wall biosynthesis